MISFIYIYKMSKIFKNNVCSWKWKTELNYLLGKDIEVLTTNYRCIF